VNKLAQRALDQALALNQRISETTANAVDWLFKRDTLIQSGRTWFELIYDSDLMAVRFYELPGEEDIELADGSRMPIRREQYPVPLVLVPPLGVTTETFDLLPQRSLVRYMVASGFRVYLVDWGKPGKEHAHLGLADYAFTMLGTAVEKIRRHSGSQDLSMMGWCLGGLLCLMHQGLMKDEHIRNIVTVASPIDLESGEGVIGAVSGVAQALDGPAKLVSSYTNLRLNTLDPARFSVPDWLTPIVFKMTDPLSSVTTYWDLVTRLWDREFVVSYSTTSDYLNNMLRYPGGVLKDMAGSMLTENQLARGRVTIGDRVAELDSIESSLLAFAGKTDNMVPAEVAKKSVEVVATDDAEFRIAPGGHMGVIIGSKAQKVVWAEMAEWLSTRSGEPPKAKRAGRKAGAAPRKKPAGRPAGKRAPAKASKAGPRKAGPRKTGPRKAGPRKAGPRKTAPRKAGPRKAGPRKAGPQS
jgi:polyhydroxyalkanoate synthase